MVLMVTGQRVDLDIELIGNLLAMVNKPDTAESGPHAPITDNNHLRTAKSLGDLGLAVDITVLTVGVTSD
jgi:hypothetical protein